MAGVVLQNGNLVWQKVKNYLSALNAAVSTTVSAGSCPAIQNSFMDLKAYLAQDKRNISLQFIPFAAEDAITAAGYLPLGAGACTFYALYARARRSTTASTKEWLQIGDGTDNTGGATQTIVSARINGPGQEFCYINGLGAAVATELYISSTTDPSGQTETTTAELSFDGFVIVGA